MFLFIGILLALIVFFIVVFLHELGHFLTARWSGVRVEEFGIGIPPRLKRLFRDKKGTEWTLNWFPIGGFVRLKGEDILDPSSQDKDAFPMAKWWKQVLILIAGVMMNFMLAAFLFGLLFFRGTAPLTVHIAELSPDSLLSRVGTGTQLIPIFDTLTEAEESGVLVRHPGVVVNPLPGSVAEKAGLMMGDIVVDVDDMSLKNPEDISRIMKKSNAGVALAILRNDMPMSIVVTPVDGKIGAYISPNITAIQYKYPFFTAMGHGIEEVWHQIGFSLRTFRAIITTSFSKTATETEKEEATAGIGGPVAIGKVFVGMAHEGLGVRQILILTAMISLSLGVFNLLPFPALDGGRIFIVVVNQMIHLVNPRFKISPKIEQIIHSIGFMILIFLSILVTYKDIFLGK